MKFLPTKAAPLPYPTAPLTAQDIIMQQVRFEEAFLPHVIYDEQLPEVMEKQLPDTRSDVMLRHMWSHQITRFMHSLI